MTLSLKFNTHQKQLLRFLSQYGVYNCLLFWIIGLQYLMTLTPFSIGGIFFKGKVYVLITIALQYFGYLGSFALFPIMIAIPFALLIPRARFILPFVIVLSCLFTIYLTADSFIYTQYRFHLNGIMLRMIFSPYAFDFFSVSTFEWTLITLIAILIVTLQVFLAKKAWNKVDSLKASNLKTHKRNFYFLTFISICLYASYIIVIFSHDFPIFRAFITNSRVLPLYSQSISWVLRGPFSMLGIERFGERFLLQPPGKIQPLNYPLNPMVCKQKSQPYNILFIIIDSWRADMLNASVTPNIYQFSKNTLQFTHHYSGGNATGPGIFTLFYGIPSPYWSSFLKAERTPVFMQTLQNAHYQFSILASATLRLPAFDKTVFRGIPNLQTELPERDLGKRDAYITRQFIDFLKQRDPNKPFFSMLFYDYAHAFCNTERFTEGPYQPTQTLCSRIGLTGYSDPTPFFNRYKNALYLDDQLTAEVLNALKENKLLENTIVIITSDHGQSFNDHDLGYFGHGGNFTPSQIQTPLLISWPKRAAKIHHYPTSHYDIVPTLMTELFGCENPIIDYSAGQSLFENKPRPYLIVGSYIDFGFVEPNRITTIFPTGNYLITGIEGRPLPEAKLDVQLLRRVFIDLNRYYKK